MLVLVLQGALSLWLTQQNTAFLDEGTYINAGHVEIAALLHGSPTYLFPYSFSGAPVLYPPLAALTDAVGGLLAARLLSLVFMLITTALLWNTAERLFGPTAAAFAGLLFAGTAAAQFLGALATYDAMTLLLLATAAWVLICYRGTAGWRLAVRLLLVMALVDLADMTKYAATLWDPVIIVLAALAVGRARGTRAGLLSGLALAAAMALSLFVLIKIAGPVYWNGIRFTTLSRRHGDTAIASIAADSAEWIGAIGALALCGSVVTLRRFARADPYLCAVCWLMTGALFLAPVEQARIHTLVSLFKHAAFGAWFAAVPAAYALSLLWSRARARRGGHRLLARLMMSGVALLVAGTMALGALQAYVHYRSWPDVSRVVPELRHLVGRVPGPYLGEEDSVLIYYTRTPVGSWQNTFKLHYHGLSGYPAYLDALRHHYFHVVVLCFTYTSALDHKLDRIIAATPGYRPYGLASAGPVGPRHDFRLWVLTSSARVGSSGG